MPVQCQLLSGLSSVVLRAAGRGARASSCPSGRAGRTRPGAGLVRSDRERGFRHVRPRPGVAVLHAPPRGRRTAAPRTRTSTRARSWHSTSFSNSTGGPGRPREESGTEARAAEQLRISALAPGGSVLPGCGSTAVFCPHRANGGDRRGRQAMRRAIASGAPVAARRASQRPAPRAHLGHRDELAGPLHPHGHPLSAPDVTHGDEQAAAL